MLGWLRILVFLFVILSVAYVMVWFRAQVRERLRLKAEYDKTKSKVSETKFVSQGLETYNRSLKPKLLLFVYCVPFILALFLLYLANM